ncbi:hypothetical protein [Desulfolutivibrio sp.]|uniref:hypothetical protein n=1 Tax=Desulfolutivibrio sp. TaxID=2773296 RepID=UPI002F96DCB0
MFNMAVLLLSNFEIFSLADDSLKATAVPGRFFASKQPERISNCYRIVCRDGKLPEIIGGLPHVHARFAGRHDPYLVEPKAGENRGSRDWQGVSRLSMIRGAQGG